MKRPLLRLVPHRLCSLLHARRELTEKRAALLDADPTHRRPASASERAAAADGDIGGPHAQTTKCGNDRIDVCTVAQELQRDVPLIARRPARVRSHS